MLKRAILVIILLIISTPAFAYKWVNSDYDKDGGYYRDTSNDGYSYNNANTLGANKGSARGWSGVKANVLGSRSDY